MKQISIIIVLALAVIFSPVSTLVAADLTSEELLLEIHIHDAFAFECLRAADAEYRKQALPQALILSEFARQSIQELEAKYLPLLLIPKDHALVKKAIRNYYAHIEDFVDVRVALEIAALAKSASNVILSAWPDPGISQCEKEIFSYYQIIVSSVDHAQEARGRSKLSEAIYRIETARQAAAELRRLSDQTASRDSGDAAIIPPLDTLDTEIARELAAIKSATHAQALVRIEIIRQLAKPPKQGI